MRIPAMLMSQKVTLEALAGITPIGETYGAPATVRASVEDEEHLVLNSEGQEVVSATKVYLDPENFVPAGSKVTVWAGKPQERTAKVIVASTKANQFLANVELHLE